MRGGDSLVSDEGSIVHIIAACERVSTVASDDAEVLVKAAYHLGNRHVPLQIETNWLRYLHDHVLDEMAKSMGLNVVVENKYFEPESGAYSHGNGHSHNHNHEY